MARLKVSQVSLHGMLKCFAETGLIMSNHSDAQQKWPHQQKINTQSFVHWDTEKQLGHIQRTYERKQYVMSISKSIHKRTL